MKKRYMILLLLIPCLCLALFTACANKVTVLYQAQEGGSLRGETEQIVRAGESCTEVEAVPDDGYRFIGWEDGYTEAKRTDSPLANATHTARFSKIFHLTYVAEEGGSIVGAATQDMIEEESGSIVVATPAEGYRFMGWDDGKQEAVRSDSVSEDKTITAKFERVFTLTYAAQEGGAVAGATTQKLLKDEAGTGVMAIAQEGYRFMGWDDGKQEAVRSDSVSEDKTITAKFERVFTLTYAAQEGGAVAGATTQKLLKDEAGTGVTAIAQEGYRFMGWDDGKQEAARSDSVSEDKTITAKFERVYSVVFLSNHDVMGEVRGVTTQYVAEGEPTVSVTAVPALGYTFIGWSDGTAANEISVRTDRDLVVIAYFEIESLGFPIIEIDTENQAPVLDKETYVPCSVSIENTAYSYRLNHAEAKIKCRGNTTMGFDKKPYKVKFTDKQDLFGFGKAKTWVLLADYFDGSMLRNRLALSCGQLIGAKVTSNNLPVEVYMNGRYIGVYLLCEQTETGKTRVDIAETISEGDDQAFLVEMDNRAPEEGVEGLDWFRHIDGGVKFFTVKSPETDSVGYDASVTENIRRIVQETWDIVATGTWEQIESRIDVDSFAQTCLIHQLFKTYDALAFSWFLYKDAGSDSKVVSGPIWDFDLSAGLGDDSHGGDPQVVKAEDLWPNGTRANQWYVQLLEHPEFKAKMRSLLAQYDIEAEIDSKVQEAKDNIASYYRNYQRWDNLHLHVAMIPAEVRELPTWEEHVDFLADYLKRSLNYLKKYYNEQP